MYFLDSSLEVIELYSLPATFSGLSIFFYMQGFLGVWNVIFAVSRIKKLENSHAEG